MDNVALGQVFSEYFGFSRQFSSLQMLPYSSIVRGYYIRPISGRRTKWTQSHLTPRNKKNYHYIYDQVFQVVA
jgi:hypothetical protein